MPDYKPRLFISHATWNDRGSRRSRALLTELSKTLNDNWDVFVDRERLSPGDSWRPIILQNLAQAQAGIILFDKRAVTDSYWVRAEALLLCFRRSINPNFQLIPVLLDDLTLTHTCFKDYEPFQLNEITAIFDEGERRTVKSFARAIAGNLDHRKAKMATGDLRGWPRAFEGLIAGHGQPTLLSAWCALTDSGSGDRNDLDRDADRMKRAIAQLMDIHPPLDTIEAVSELVKEEINKVRMGSLMKGKCVENETVELMFNSARDPDKLGLLTYLTCDVRGLSPIKNLFDRLDIERPRNVTIKTLTVSEDAPETVEGIVAHIERVITETLDVLLDVVTPNAGLRLTEKAWKHIRERIYLVICYIPPKLAVVEVVSILRRRYKKIVFLVHLTSAAEIGKFEAIGGRPLTPPLEVEKLNEFKLLRLELESFGINIDS
jgi:hypothetical protein